MPNGIRNLPLLTNLFLTVQFCPQLRPGPDMPPNPPGLDHSDNVIIQFITYESLFNISQRPRQLMVAYIICLATHGIMLHYIDSLINAYEH